MSTIKEDRYKYTIGPSTKQITIANMAASLFDHVQKFNFPSQIGSINNPSDRHWLVLFSVTLAEEIYSEVLKRER